MTGSYDPLHDIALLLAAVTQTAGSQVRVATDPLMRISSRLGFTHKTDPSEIEDALRGTIERRVRRETAREVLELAEAERKLSIAGAPNKGPWGDAVTSLRRLARGEPLPRPEELRGGVAGE
jgi:hypothetical protein